MKKIPQEAIWRLSSYLRVLTEISSQKQNVSSFELAEALGINPNQLRKDLSYFGKFGIRGVGYEAKELIHKIKQILGLDKAWCVALCGLGNLGRALSFYRGFQEQGFTIKAIFEKDPKKIGKRFNSIEIFNIKDLKKKIEKYKINIAILTVPVDQAQDVALDLYQAGVRAILNFTPQHINLSPDCRVRDVYMSAELIHLSYFLANK